MRLIAPVLLAGGLLLAGCGSPTTRCPAVSCPTGLECLEGECVEPADPCASIQCKPHAVCEDRLGVVACVCSEHFEADLTGCLDVDACRPEDVGCLPGCHFTGCATGYCDDELGHCVECRVDGDCEEDEDCVDSHCVPSSCVPETCAQLGAECGAPPNRCGGTLDCGECTDVEACDRAYTCREACTDGGCSESQVCEPTMGVCVECMEADECCDLTGHCSSCHPQLNVCVECITDVDCGDSGVCRTDPVRGPNVCLTGCRGDLDCPLTGVCVDGGCRMSYCAPTGTMGGVTVQATDYGSSCFLLGEEGEVRYQGFCLGPIRHGDLIGGICQRVGTRTPQESCSSDAHQGMSDESLCAGTCFSGSAFSTFCLSVCLPGGCDREYCVSNLAGLLGVCLPGWNGEPKPVGTACTDELITNVYMSCGEGRLCIAGSCRVACDQADLIGCSRDGEVCRPIRHPDNTNEMIGFCG